MSPAISRPDFLGVARIQKALPNRVFSLTFRGDALQSLELPSRVWMYKEESEQGSLDIAYQGLFKDDIQNTDTLQVAELTCLWGFQKGKVRAKLNLRDSSVGSDDFFRGFWLCILTSDLALDCEAPFSFQVKGMSVTCREEKVGKVIDYFETDAHGILIVLTLGGDEVMIPFTEGHVNIQSDFSSMEVRQFSDFSD